MNLDSFIENSVFMGGILPLIFFAFMDFSYRVFAGKHHFQNVFLYTSIGGMITMYILALTLFNIPVSELLSLFTLSALGAGTVLGVLWGIGTLSLGLAYERYKANASQVLPIASASGLLGGFLGIFFLNENVTLWFFILSAGIILCGMYFLTTAEARKVSSLTSAMGILLGGIIPLIAFGVLNVLFKYWSAFHPAILGITMAGVGALIALIVQYIRKTPFTHNPKFLSIGGFWALAVGFLGYGFYPLLGNASLLLPLVGASPLVSMILVGVFLKEKVYWWKIILGTLCILFGISVIHII